MLIRSPDDGRHHIVMAVIFDKEESRQLYIYSAYGNSNGQYQHPAQGCTVIDDTIPANWETSYDKNNQWQITSFPEWTRDLGGAWKGSGFYERYINGDPKAVTTFKKYFDIERQKYKDDPQLAEDLQS